MTALAASNTNLQRLNDSRYNTYPLAASTTIYQGAMVVLNYLGQAIAASGALGALQGHLRVVGVSAGRLQPGKNGPVDADTAAATLAGDYDVLVETGKFTFVNGSASNGGAATDTITSADIGCYAYAQDDQTVSRDGLSGTRPVVGVIKEVCDDGRIAVEITGERWSPLSTVIAIKAGADFSSLRNTIVKLEDDTDARVVPATADTDALFGIIINAPAAANAVAWVITAGPAPCLVGASGIAAGANVTSTAGGASIAASTADKFVGKALQDGASGETQMVYVQPGIMPA